jgi:hypothetical protein
MQKTAELRGFIKYTYFQHVIVGGSRESREILGFSQSSENAMKKPAGGAGGRIRTGF